MVNNSDLCKPMDLNVYQKTKIVGLLQNQPGFNAFQVLLKNDQKTTF